MSRVLEPLVDDVLSTVRGGAGMNVDHASTRWRSVQVGDVPVPYPITRSSQQRTPFGACVDRAVAACERAGGSRSSIGDCKLAEIHRCWTQEKSR